MLWETVSHPGLLPRREFPRREYSDICYAWKLGQHFLALTLESVKQSKRSKTRNANTLTHGERKVDSFQAVRVEVKKVTSVTPQGGIIQDLFLSG